MEISLEVYRKMPSECQAMLALMVYFPQGYTASKLYRLMRTSTLAPGSGRCAEILEYLHHRKFVAQKGRNDNYYWEAQVSCAAMCAMGDCLTFVHGWPAFDDLEKVLVKKSCLGSYYDKWQHRLTSEYLYLAQVMHWMVGGPPLPKATRQYVSSPEGRGVLRESAWRLYFGLVDSPDCSHLTATDDRLEFLFYWLNLAFVFGSRDVRPLLDQMDAAVADLLRKTKNKLLLDQYGAMRFWCGQVDPLKACADGRPFTAVLRAVLFLSVGDIPSANALLRKEIDPGNLSPEQRDVWMDMFPVRCLAAMAQAAMKPEKPMKTRPSQLFQEVWKNSRHSDYCYSIGDSYRCALHECCDTIKEGWEEALDGKGRGLRQIKRENLNPRRLDVLTTLVSAWNYRMMINGRDRVLPEAQQLVQRTVDLDRLGFASLARLLAALLFGSYDAQAQSAWLARLAETGIRLVDWVKPPEEWHFLLQDLRKVVAKDLKDEGVANASSQWLRWCIVFRSEGRGTPLCSLRMLSAQICTQRADGTVEMGKPLDMRDFSRKWVQSVMTSQDRQVFAWMEAWMNVNVSPYSSSLKGTFFQRSILNVLADMEGLYEWLPPDSASEGVRQLPIKLERRPLEMETSFSADGGVVLQLPKWARNLTDSQVLCKVAEGHYALVSIAPEVTEYLKLFEKYGEDGKIVLPKAAMEEASDLLRQVVKRMPIAEPTEEEAKNFPHVQSTSDVRVRLVYDGGVLDVCVVLLPVADNPNLVLEPGEGAAEKVVRGIVASFVVVRDLARERERLQAVRAALAECGPFADGAAHWRITDLEAGLDALRALKSVEAQVPMEWMRATRLQVFQAASGWLQSNRAAEDWFSVEGSFDLDDGRVLNVVQMLEAVRARHGKYVQLSNGDFVSLSQKMLKELEALNAASRRKGTGVEIVRAALPMLDQALGGADAELALPEMLAATAKEIRSELTKRRKPPAALEATLRPYQKKGYRWLSCLAACRFGACLADDMGLGKTVQVIALLLERAAEGPSLVIAPASVCGNWRGEIRRFAPTLKPVLSLEDIGRVAEAQAGDVVLASYGFVLHNEPAFASVEWNGLVLDEAQAIKNHAAKRSRMVKSFRSKFRVAVTGTPVENRLTELWSLFEFLNPGLLGTESAFADRFTQEGKASPALKKLVQPLILRRLKGDVLTDLPEKTEVTIPVVLGKAERTAYEGCRRSALLQLADAEGRDSRFAILAELTRLRRFCCHPDLVLPGEHLPSAKMEALVDLLEGLHDSRHRALVFSQFVDYLALVRKMLEAHGWSHLYLDGSTPTLERDRLVQAFQSGEASFFLISLKAGGTGLNLTAANYVVLLDPWWNPAVENQAADRAHRIGQRSPVTVYRLIASDTVEERVVELHREKKEMAEDVLEGTGSSSLTPKQLMKLFGSSAQGES